MLGLVGLYFGGFALAGIIGGVTSKSDDDEAAMWVAFGFAALWPLILAWIIPFIIGNTIRRWARK